MQMTAQSWLGLRPNSSALPCASWASNRASRSPGRCSLTEQDGLAGPIPDLVNRDFAAEKPGEKMVGDITYIETWQGWLYLS
jgi:transposase InsO family protein